MLMKTGTKRGRALISVNHWMGPLPPTGVISTERMLHENVQFDGSKNAGLVIRVDLSKHAI